MRDAARENEWVARERETEHVYVKSRAHVHRRSAFTLTWVCFPIILARSLIGGDCELRHYDAANLAAGHEHKRIESRTNSDPSVM